MLPPDPIQFDHFLFSLPLMNWYLVLDKYTSFFLSFFLTSLSFLPIFLLHENLTGGCHVCSVGPESKIYLCVSKLHVWTVSFLVVLECMTEWRVSPWTKQMSAVKAEHDCHPFAAYGGTL